MLQEMKVETLRAAQVNPYLQHLEQHDNQPCAGRWASEFGPLNQVFTLLDPPALAAAVQYPADSSGLAALRPGDLVHRETWPLRAVKAYRPIHDALYELREYTLHPGTHGRFVNLMLQSMQVRERYSPNVAIWVPLAGNPDRVLHLWAYRDLVHRDEARAGVAQEPAWKTYTEAIVPLLKAMHSTVLRPAKR